MCYVISSYESIWFQTEGRGELQQYPRWHYVRSKKEEKLLTKNTYLKFGFFCHGIVAKINGFCLWFCSITTPWLTPEPFLRQGENGHIMLSIIRKILNHGRYISAVSHKDIWSLIGSKWRDFHHTESSTNNNETCHSSMQSETWKYIPMKGTNILKLWLCLIS